MARHSGYRPPSTAVRCDNPKCNALYEVPNLLGGHTFTCKKCGSRVTIRDVSVWQERPRGSLFRGLFKWRQRKISNTPLVDKIVAASDRRPIPVAKVILVGLLLVFAAVGLWIWLSGNPRARF